MTRRSNNLYSRVPKYVRSIATITNTTHMDAIMIIFFFFPEHENLL